MDIRNRVIEARLISADDLRKNPRNWRKHPAQQQKALRKVLHEIGFAGALLAYDDPEYGLTLIDGHLRKDEIGSMSIHVLMTDLSRQEANALLALHDPLSAMAGQDDELLKGLIAELPTLNLGDVGADVAALAGLMMETETAADPGAQVDRAAELQERWQTARGDVWLIESKSGKGVHRLMCGDSARAEDVEKLLGGQMVDICFTSPPYNVAANSNLPDKDKYLTNTDDLSSDDYLSFLVSFITIALKFSEYVFVNIQSVSGNKTALIELLYALKKVYAETIIWDKCSSEPAMASNVLNSRYEYIHVFSKKANRAIGKKVFRGTLENLISIPSRQGNEFSGVHKATYPAEFAQFFVSNFSMASVFDPFLGSGTTMIAAEQTGRVCYGMEIAPEYVAVALQRCADMGLDVRREA